MWQGRFQLSGLLISQCCEYSRLFRVSTIFLVERQYKMTESTRNQEQTSCLVITEQFLHTKGGTAVLFALVFRRICCRVIHIVTADVPHADDFVRSHSNTVLRVWLRRYR